nr:MAG TPA: hypothetical protein [Caudoviricetes sp.]
MISFRYKKPRTTRYKYRRCGYSCCMRTVTPHEADATSISGLVGEAG